MAPVLDSGHARPVHAGGAPAEAPVARADATNVLLLCTHNSARSILAEGMLNHMAQRLGLPVHGHSAGSAPSGLINPLALEVLEAAGVALGGLWSKSWAAFAADGAPRMRIVVTVCDQAASEPCPFWPGAPVTTHWGYPDPSRVGGDLAARRSAFELTRQALAYRLLQLLTLPMAALGDAELSVLLERIGRS